MYILLNGKSAGRKSVALKSPGGFDPSFAQSSGYQSSVSNSIQFKRETYLYIAKASVGVKTKMYKLLKI